MGIKRQVYRKDVLQRLSVLSGLTAGFGLVLIIAGFLQPATSKECLNNIPADQDIFLPNITASCTGFDVTDPNRCNCTGRSLPDGEIRWIEFKLSIWKKSLELKVIGFILLPVGTLLFRIFFWFSFSSFIFCDYLE